MILTSCKTRSTKIDSVADLSKPSYSDSKVHSESAGATGVSSTALFTAGPMRLEMLLSDSLGASSISFLGETAAESRQTPPQNICAL